MDQYTKSTPRVIPNERETSFAQQGKKKFDYWKNKECHTCGEKGHPSYKCPNKDDDKDDKSRSSKKSSKSSKSKSSNKKVEQMQKEMKSIKNHLHRWKHILKILMMIPA